MIDFHIIQHICERNVDLKPFTTWKLGGPADYFFRPKSNEDLKNTLNFLRLNNIPYFLLGNGSNILFDDKGVRGAVIKLEGHFETLKIDENNVTVGSSVWAPFLGRKLGDLGLSGVEHIVGIPATIGGLTYMNGGSKRNNLSQNITEVKVIDTSGNITVMKSDQCDFSYRESIFKKRKDLIILSTTLSLEKKNPQAVKLEMLQILTERSKKFPRKFPNCGSVFQSIGEVYQKFGPPGKIIEDLNFKGKIHKSVQVSELHANFITHDGLGKSKDVLELIEIIRNAVLDKTGFIFPVEPVYITTDCLEKRI